MEINEYVRTKDYEHIRSMIAKIIDIKEDYIYLDIDKNTNVVWTFDSITKHNKDFIKVLEKGDICIDYNDDLYVVDYIYNDYVFTTTKVNKTTIKTLVDYQIKKVLTHEQLEANAYTIEKER